MRMNAASSQIKIFFAIVSATPYVLFYNLRYTNAKALFDNYYFTFCHKLAVYQNVNRFACNTVKFNNGTRCKIQNFGD